jgi:mRNA interferase MazF
MRRGEIVIVAMRGDFGKVRPCVVVQSERYRDDFDSVIVCPFSTSIAASHILRIRVEPHPSNGLRNSSVIMTDKSAAVQMRRIRERIGAVQPETLANIDSALALLLELNQRVS